jgi:tRNA dimethylallyltransferase
MLVVIGGTTASGKSALALRLAAMTGGVIVNADASQLYRDLPLLTARPTAADEVRAEHRLYGVLAAHETGSAGRWLELAGPVLAELRAAGRPAIVVGGTGLYLGALLRGIAPVPDIPSGLRQDLRATAARTPPAQLHERLAAHDPVMAARLSPTDRQRVLRALEVVLATGRSLAEWQAMPPFRLDLPALPLGLALLPPRSVLAPRVAARLEAMIEAGALDELRAWRDRPDVPPTAALHKATGVPELSLVLDGCLDLATGLARAAKRTLQYAKRQRTFFRHQLPDLVAMPVTAEDVTDATLRAWVETARSERGQPSLLPAADRL